MSRIISRSTLRKAIAAWLEQGWRVGGPQRVAPSLVQYAWLADASEFTVSLLATGQVAAARLFGLHSRREVDKWAQVAHELWGAGTPVLADCCARFLCRVAGRFTTGDRAPGRAGTGRARSGSSGPRPCTTPA